VEREPLDLEPEHWSMRRTWQQRAIAAEAEVESLRAELARRDEQITAVRAVANGGIFGAHDIGVARKILAVLDMDGDA
jgi:hypothetical protein